MSLALFDSSGGPVGLLMRGCGVKPAEILFFAKPGFIAWSDKTGFFKAFDLSHATVMDRDVN